MIQRIENKILAVPDVKFYGISVRYSMSGQADGTNPPLYRVWAKAEEEGLWDVLRAQQDKLWVNAPVGIYYDFDQDHDGCFSYAVGMFCHPEADLPEELFCRAFSACRAAVCLFRYGKEEDVWAVNPHGVTEQYRQDQGLSPLEDGWCAESYHDDLCQPGEECLGYWIACRHS